MKHKYGAVLYAALLWCTGCNSEPEAAPLLNWSPPPEKSWEISALDGLSRSKSGAGSTVTFPAWVNAYINGGISSVESIFPGRYIFVSVMKGNNFNALRQWTAGFLPDKDFPRLLADRVQKRLTSGLTTYPDAEYGSFFELTIKAFSDASYEGAMKEDDFWFLRTVFDEESQNAGQEEYSFLIMVSIDKNELAAQVNAILDGITPDPKPSRAQAASINRVRSLFFIAF
jgi:hypothetical protein